jgi:peptidoglycan/xylan/chitin deacetylase (PgdA/CDA1 family)
MKQATACVPAISTATAEAGNRPPHLDAPEPYPILLYHSVDDDPPPWIAPFTVSREAFERQLDLVVASGRIPIAARQAVSALRGGQPLPARPVLITFDDAFEDFGATALPALRDRGLPAALFVTTGALAPRNRSLLPAARMMDRAAVVEAARLGVEIGAHTHTHPQLDTLPDEAVATELRRSKEDLEDILGQAVTLLAYPHGYSDRRVRQLARSTGYGGAFAVRNALSSGRDDMFQLARLTVRADTTTEQFARWLRAERVPVAASHESVRTKLWRAYRKGKALIHAGRDGYA